ncbi:MAG: NADH-quinone oxidoreductase subunit J [Planctomycetota bacterium]|nr:NADH-quinone oxidoreductase subunit J [Planctomycetota bacterium]
MAPMTLYTTCLLGAVGLYLLVRRPAPGKGPGGAPGGTAGSRSLKALGTLLALGAFGYLIIAAAEWIAPGEGGRPEVFYVIFSGIAVAAAVRMITHRRPVYAALYFVLVVLSSAGLFLLLEAEFLAFALVIVYAGAILITYLFVLMLAQQPADPDHPEGGAEYDIHPREPAAGALVGFIMLALLSRMIFMGAGELPVPDGEAARAAAWRQLEQMPQRLRAFIAESGDENITLGWGDEGAIDVAADGSAMVRYEVADGQRKALTLPEDAMPENVQSVGLGLILTFPVSLELAGVILLMAMFGAVILARRQIELTEEEKREAAGLRRLGHFDEPAAPEGGGG